MITCYTTHPPLRKRLAAALMPHMHDAFAESWRELERRSPDAKVSVIGIEWLHGDPLYPLLVDFKRRLPLHPVVLVTSRDAENSALIRQVRPEEVVWIVEVERGFVLPSSAPMLTPR